MRIYYVLEFLVFAFMKYQYSSKQAIGALMNAVGRYFNTLIL